MRSPGHPRRVRTLLVIVVALASALVLGACGGADDDRDDGGAASKPAVYTEADTEITVARGDTFVIALPATPSTGFSWSAAPNDLVSLVDSKQVAGGSAPGASGTQRMTFAAGTAGTTTLELDYSRPFEQGVPPAETASFAVTVTR